MHRLNKVYRLAALVGCLLCAATVFGEKLAGQNEQEQIQTLLDAVCQAQKPTRNMRMKWIYESEGGWMKKGGDAPGAKYPRHTKFEFSATISGIRSRIEQLQESYESKDDKEPYMVTHKTRVFNGTTQRMLSKPIKAKRTQLSGSQYMQDLNSSALRYRLFEWPDAFELRNQEIRKRYKFSLIESDIPGIHIVEAVDEYGGRYRLTIDGERGFNVIKFECIRTDNSKDYEVNTTLKQYADGIWYVAGRELIRHPLKGLGPDKPYVQRRMHVTQAEFNIEIPEETFELEFPIGTKVWDGVLEDWFVVGDSGAPTTAHELVDMPVQDKGSKDEEATKSAKQQGLWADVPGADTSQARTKQEQEEADDAPLAEATGRRANLVWFLLVAGALGVVMVILFPLIIRRRVV